MTNWNIESVAADDGWNESELMLDVHKMGALLLLSAIRGAAKRAEMLLRLGANPNYRGGKFGDTALTSAVIMGKREIVELLINYKANVNIQDFDGGTPLIWATLGQHADLVQLLLDRGADPNIRENDGQTALQLAIEHNFIHIERILRDAGATP
ncbi:MAG: ankyrin repeat domain-containing protein [Tumebacillaceae bacterium]